MISIINVNNNNINEIIKNLKGRSNTINIRKSVEEIIENIKLHGNKALREYTLKFDNVELKDFLISNEEIEEAYKQCDKTMIRILEECKNNITKYHEKQKETGYIYQKELGIYMGQRIIPVDSVGVYVPGGKAAYPSSVLMNIIPAQVAGVQDIIIATPPNYNNKVNSNILVAARVCGINKIYKIGGAQVSTKHTGFIVNVDNATCKDVLDLIGYVQTTVYNKFNVKLTPEVIIIGGDK